MLRSSEDTEEEFTSDCIGDESRDDTHHSPATIVGLCVLLGRLQTLAVVLFYNHLGFFSKEILLPELISRYSHLLNVVNLYILYRKKEGPSRPSL